jgi:hypothetical protein
LIKYWVFGIAVTVLRKKQMEISHLEENFGQGYVKIKGTVTHGLKWRPK